MPTIIKLKPAALMVGAGGRVTLKATGLPDVPPRKKHVATLYAWDKGEFIETKQVNLHSVDAHTYAVLMQPGTTPTVVWDSSPEAPGFHNVSIRIFERPKDETLQQFLDFFNENRGNYVAEGQAEIEVTKAAAEPLRVSMRRADVSPTSDQALWTVIRHSTNALSYQNYSDFMDIVLCGDTKNVGEKVLSTKAFVGERLKLPFPDVDAYLQLKVATEVFMMLNCGVSGVGSVSGADLDQAIFADMDLEDPDAEGRRYYRAVLPGAIERYWKAHYLDAAATGRNVNISTLPYLALIRRKLKDVFVVSRDPTEQQAAVACMEILMTKLTMPCFLELIWSYWHEEGMLVQTMNAITWRFQNRRGPSDRDPLALIEIDPLRPLNSFIWGYIQDEQHRLTVPRRVYEYDHHYGLTMLGKAVPTVRGADSRTRFLEAFHHLLYVCSIFLKEDDDTTVVADGFPALNALKEVHLLLTQGAHNQYGDLPWTARQEMLMQEWLLARPEFREFLPRRIMVDYPEDWMDSVETMKTLQGWTDVSIMHFRDLGVFGEQILLGIRFGAWPSVIESEQAANWVRYWRPEIQGYIHAYRAVTGVDLTDRVDATMPAVLLQRREAQQTLPAGSIQRGIPAGADRRGLPAAGEQRGLPAGSPRTIPSKLTT